MPRDRARLRGFVGRFLGSWQLAFGELVIVFLGVLIALSADQWMQRRPRSARALDGGIMLDTHRIVTIARGLGIASIVAFVLTIFALMDLFRGGENLALELWTARIGLVVILGFHVTALVALSSVLRGRSDPRGRLDAR